MNRLNEKLNEILGRWGYVTATRVNSIVDERINAALAAQATKYDTLLEQVGSLSSDLENRISGADLFASLPAAQPVTDFTSFLDLASKTSEAKYLEILTSLVQQAGEAGYKGVPIHNLKLNVDLGREYSHLSVTHMALGFSHNEDGTLKRETGGLGDADSKNYGSTVKAVDIAATPYQVASDSSTGGGLAFISQPKTGTNSLLDYDYGYLVYPSGNNAGYWKDQLRTDLPVILDAYLIGSAMRLKESGPFQVGTLMKTHRLERYQSLLDNLAAGETIDPRIASSIVSAYRD